MRFVLFLYFLLFSSPLLAQKGHFTMSPNCVDAYNEMIRFNLAEGHATLNKEIKADPYNHLVVLLQNYEDFVRLIFNDDPAFYSRRVSYKDKRLSFLEKGDKKSPYYRLVKGIIHLQWSLIHIKYKENWRAANDFRKAHNLFKENKKLFPQLKENNIFYGAQQAIIGTIPKDYQWISNFLGMQGNIKNGMYLLKSSIQQNDAMFQAEAKFFYIYLHDIILNDNKKAMRLMSSYRIDTKDNYLFTFMSSNLMLNNYRATEAISLIQNRNKSAGYLQPIVFDYALGAAYLHNLEYHKAIPYLQKYLKSKSYFYKKDAALKIAYAYHLMDNSKNASLYLNLIPKVGSSITDMDKQATKIYQSKTLGNASLLKARLLFDGGNFSQSTIILEDPNLQQGLSDIEQLEWNYRLARVYDESRKNQAALNYYKKTLYAANPTNEYYPARAALQIAYIYERSNNTTLAIKYFKQVLSMNGHQYKTSLDHKAKSGLLRITNK